MNKPMRFVHMKYVKIECKYDDSIQEMYLNICKSL